MIIISVALFGFAVAAGTYLVFGQRTPAPVAVAAPANPPAPAAMPAAMPDVTPEELRVALETLAPERPTTVADYLANMPSLGIDEPTGAPDPVPVAAAAAEPAPSTDCIAALDAEAAGLVVSFAPYAVDTLADELFPVMNLARRVEACDGAYIVVAGHADPSGDETQNLVLSWQRAEFVAEALANAGFDADRIEAIGFGSRRPVSEGAAGSDDTLNRRVDFVVREALP